ncbi:hypothetical protein QYF61_004259 [Mycteria americana]|uniref:Uncharacterized protein n=1 Tax=Mycteria americana TaxID=33587 RepID=A0AAN7MPR0_MYCAM|nr:hypothetical protein QYF61_004259 [Mycteria americana]
MIETGIQTASENTMVEIGTQTTTTTVIASAVKKKQWTRRSTGPYHRLVREEEEEEVFDQEVSPSAKKLEEGMREIRQEAETTQSLTSKEIQDMRKDYSRQPARPTVSNWKVRKPNRWYPLLETGELREKLEKRQQLSVSGGGSSQGKRTSAEEGIHYLRELAVLEVIYGDLDNNQVSKDPEDVLCIWAM